MCRWAQFTTFTFLRLYLLSRHGEGLHAERKLEPTAPQLLAEARRCLALMVLTTVSHRRMDVLHKTALVSRIEQAVLQISGDLVADEEGLKCKNCNRISNAFLSVMDSLLDIQHQCLTTMEMSENGRNFFSDEIETSLRGDSGISSHRNPCSSDSKHEHTTEAVLRFSKANVDENSIHVSKHSLQQKRPQTEQVQLSSDEELSQEDQLKKMKSWSPDIAFSVPVRPLCVPRLPLHRIALMKRRAHSRQEDSLLHLQLDATEAEHANESTTDAKSLQARVSPGFEAGDADLDAYLQLLIPTMWKPLRGWAVFGPTQQHHSTSSAAQARPEPAHRSYPDDGSLEGRGTPGNRSNGSETEDIETAQGKTVVAQSQTTGREREAKCCKDEDSGVGERVPSTPSRPCRHPVPRSAEEAWNNHTQHRAQLKVPSDHDSF